MSKIQQESSSEEIFNHLQVLNQIITLDIIANKFKFLRLPAVNSKVV
jgi:hypothetical protein